MTIEYVPGTWELLPDASDVFTKLSSYPPMIEDEDIKIIEKFVVTMYDRSSTSETVDEARLELFARKQNSNENIPPTHAALVEHSKRAAFQAACIWSRALDSQIGQETPAEWGWVQEGDGWKVHWTSLPTIAQSCQQLQHRQTVQVQQSQASLHPIVHLQ